MTLKENIDAAIKALKEGGVILYPTDTVWGLGCDATNEKAVEKIYKIKKRVDSKSLIILVSDMDMVCRYIKIVPEIAEQLTEVSDTPLTIIYPGAIGLASNVIASDGTIGMRIPNHEFCEQLLKKFHRPIVSTSANISGEPTPLTFQEIDDKISESVDFIADVIFEEGSTGKPSSIIKLGTGGEVEIIRK